MTDELDIVDRHSQSAPVDLEAIFDDLGVDYREEHVFEEASGWIERNGDRYTVTVNAFDPEMRRRFTAAHELAHYLLHRDLLEKRGRMNRHTDRLWDDPHSGGSHIDHRHEVQANKMAAQIIMPAELVRREYRLATSLAALAKSFRVSKRAMEIRLETLGLPALP